MSNQTILVTGATGFVGNHAVDRLLELGEPVRVTVRATSNLRWLEGKPVETIEVDLRTPEGIREAVAGTRGVLHFAGRTRARSREEFFAANAEATASLSEAFAAQASEDGAFVNISSLAAGGPARQFDRRPFPYILEDDPARPVSHYGESKLAGEHAVNRFAERIRVVSLRPPAVYGPRDVSILKFFRSIQRGWLPLPRPKGTLFSLIHVRDLVEASIQALRTESACGTYYVSDGSAHTWEDVGRRGAEILGTRPRAVRVPMPVTMIVGLASELVGRLTGRAPLIGFDKIRELREPFWVCLPGKASREFGFTPRVELPKGLEETITWYQKQGWLRAAP